VLSPLSFGGNERQNKKELADSVKKEFLHAWNGYKKYAWGFDALKPLSKSGHNWYSESLLMTPIDAFDTMILMDLKDEAAEAKELILNNLSFDKDIFVQNFEITIRLLGGLLSCYQLDGDERFLQFAKDLGNRLLPVFNSPTGMPYVMVNLKTGETRGKINNPAEIGTLMIEFGVLSKLTSNNVYYDKAKKAISALFERRSAIDLVGTTINVETGEWQNKESHLSGMIDSYYEYLLKSWLLFDDSNFKEMYEISIAAVKKYLTDNRDTGLWFGRADMNTGERTATKFGALDAFFPAVLALGGDITTAEELQKSCFKMWNLYDIEPEQIDYASMNVLYASYVLRPEIIESAYYLYSLTKNDKYLHMGKKMFGDIVKHCRTESGYAALKSVITKEKDDSMESFFLAETLKYFYLLFAPSDKIDLSMVIFNTEAHPMFKSFIIKK
jgi:mannosidase alpha-like ER degradation enhancer 2